MMNVIGLLAEFLSFWFAAPQLLGPKGLAKLERGFEWALKYIPWPVTLLGYWLLYLVLRALWKEAGPIAIGGAVIVTLLISAGGIWVLLAVNRVLIDRRNMTLDEAADAFGEAIDNLSGSPIFQYLKKNESVIMIGVAILIVIVAILSCQAAFTILLGMVIPFLGLTLYYMAIAFISVYTKALLNILADDSAIRRRAVAWAVALFGIGTLIQLFTPGSGLSKLGGLVELISVMMAAPELMQIKVITVQKKMLLYSVYVFIVAALLQLIAPSEVPERLAALLMGIAGLIAIPVTLEKTRTDAEANRYLLPAAAFYVIGVAIQITTAF
jgi:hypothetical protein